MQNRTDAMVATFKAAQLVVAVKKKAALESRAALQTVKETVAKAKAELDQRANKTNEYGALQKALLGDLSGAISGGVQ